MMPLTRQEIEILLDATDSRDYVVSAYVDMTVKNGFARDVELHLKNQAKAAAEALSSATAARSLEANLELIRQIVSDRAGSPISALAIFTSVSRGLRHVVPLDFEVENHLVIDEQPYLLPLLERWYGEPISLIALLDSDQAHLFLAHHRHPEWVRDLERKDAGEQFLRDKPRFTYKKRFARAQHERLHSIEDDRFVHQVSEVIVEEWRRSHLSGLILLGQPPTTAALRRLLPRDLEAAIAGEAHHTMTSRPEELSNDVGRILDAWRIERERAILAEIHERWKRRYLIGNGPSEVLDALQQGRAAMVVFGTRHDLTGARCLTCGYRFGEPVEICPYCHGDCGRISAAQEIFRMAIRHKVPVHLFSKGKKDDPLSPVGVCAFLHAEANWASPVPSLSS
jgi:hypothetical protein